MKQTNRRHLKIATVWILTALAVFFIAKYFFGNVILLQKNIASVSWPVLFACGVCYFLSIYLRAASWQFLVAALTKWQLTLQKFGLWFVSETTRYVPGNIWSFASRTYFLGQRDVPKKTSLFLVPLEVAVTALAAFVVSLPSLGIFFKASDPNRLAKIVVVAVCVAVIAVIVKTRLIPLKSRLSAFSRTVDRRHLAISFVLQFFGWIFYGIGTTLLLLHHASDVSIVQAISVSVLAWLIGYVSLITPMGLGVREATFAFLLAGYVSPATALFVSLLSRLVLVIVEALNAGIWLFVQRKIFSVSEVFSNHVQTGHSH